MMADQYDKLVKQTYRYYYDDGLVELAVGLLFGVTGLGLLAWQSSSAVVRGIMAVGLPLLVIGGAYAIKRFVGEVKERITYPRTGYVAYRQEEPSRGRWLIVLAALAVAIAGFILPEVLNKVSFALGALLAAVLAFLGYRSAVNRFYLAALVSLTAGVLATALLDDEALATAVTMLTAGLALVITGSLTLVTYLRRHPAPESE